MRLLCYSYYVIKTRRENFQFKKREGRKRTLFGHSLGQLWTQLWTQLWADFEPDFEPDLGWTWA